MNRTLTHMKFLATIMLCTVIINQYNVMSIQASQVTSKRSNLSKVMSESEALVIKDIRQACLYIVSQSLSKRDLIAKFGSLPEGASASGKAKPFNPYFESVDAPINVDNSSVTDIMYFHPKPGKISVEALRQEFGEYSHRSPDGFLPTETVRFDLKVTHNGIEKDCKMHVVYEREVKSRFLPVDVKNETIESISIMFQG
jgi:hypothetical protein